MPRERPLDDYRAARLWCFGADTSVIAAKLRVPEHVIYKRLAIIKSVARAYRTLMVTDDPFADYPLSAERE